MPVSRRKFLKASLAGGVAVGALGRLLAQEQQTRPNVLFIITDQQPVSTIGAYGNRMAKTPNLDRLAREGIRFDNFHIAAFPCSPSRACFFTGQYPQNHGVVQNDIVLRDDIPSMGKIFKAAGYQTAFIGKWHLGGRMYARTEKDKWSWKRVPDPDRFKYDKTGAWRGGEDEPQCGFTDKWVGGWKHYREYLKKVGLGEMLRKYPGIGNHNIAPSAPEGKHMYSLVPEEHHMSAFLAKEAEKFIREERDPNKPFCMVLSFYGPHLPVAPPRPWDTLFDPSSVPLPENHEDLLRGKPIGQRTNLRCYKLPFWTKEQFKDYVARYWGYCAYIDKQIGRVLKALDDLNLTDDTVIVFTSDHGDMVAAHGFIFKLGSCGYDELMRVPFLLRYPRLVKGGGETAALVSSIDTLPTLLDICGIRTPDTVQGKSFVELLRGGKADFRDVVFTHTISTIVARNERWKYAFNWTRRDFEEFYDMKEKPLEVHNRATDESCRDALSRLKKDVSLWLGETKHPYRKRIEDIMFNPVTEKGAIEPRITSFRQVEEDGKVIAEMDIEWHINAELSRDIKYWCFVQLLDPKLRRNPILTRDTRWPEPPTTEWQSGKVYKISKMRIVVPKEISGRFPLRVGLFSPERKTNPPYAGGNILIGMLEIERRNGKTKLRLIPLGG